jgi:hypothetical protein
MPIELTPHFLELIADAALKSFWRKRALRHFLRRCGISERYLATWSSEEESKRDFLDRLFPEMERAKGGANAISRMARALSDQTSFPDLEGWEDSKEKKKQAEAAVAALRQYIRKEEERVVEEKDRAATQKRARDLQARIINQRVTLDKLRIRLDALAAGIGTQESGYAFEAWFYDLLDYFEVLNRKPYVTGGRQIDGSATIDGTTYLIELKFTKYPIESPDVDILFKKVHDKADNTMGIMFSMSGWSSGAIIGASGPRTLLLLFDYSHLYFLLTGSITFIELINRVRRHSSQTGEAYLAVTGFGS